MPDRRTVALHRLGLALLAAAFLGALGLGAWPLVAWRADLQWAVINSFSQPRYTEDTDLQQRYGHGFTVFIRNDGRAASQDVEVILGFRPEHVDVVHRDPDSYRLTLSDDGIREEGLRIDLGPLAPDETAELIIFRGFETMVDVLEGNQPVEESFPDPENFAPRAWLPDWLIYSGALALAGLALQVLALCQRLAAADRRGLATRIDSGPSRDTPPKAL
jgi:hypothetical protein